MLNKFKSILVHHNDIEIFKHTYTSIFILIPED